MTRVALALAAVIGLGMMQLSAQPPTFRTGTELVSFGVTVTDRREAFLEDLLPEAFEILEDGKPQTITHFARGDQEAESLPLHVGLLFDTSGSMGNDIAMARTAAVRFLNTLKDAEDMTLVDFDTEVRVARYGQADFPRLVERIRSRRPEGMTAMYDALGVYLDGASDNDGRTILVLFTDGGDTRSTIRFNDVLTLLRASDVTVHAVGFLRNQSGRLRVEQQSSLSRIAVETGGRAFFPSSLEEIDEAYDRIVTQIRAQYTLGYISTNPATDGRWRKVEIRVAGPDRGSLRVHARKGYFAPYRPN